MKLIPGFRTAPAGFALLCCMAFLFIFYSVEIAATSSPIKNRHQSKPRANTNPAIAGEWSAVLPLPAVPIHATLLPNRQVMFWARDDARLDSDTFVWNMETNQVTTIVNPYTHLFCAGHSLLPDGRLIATGGHHIDAFRGEPHTNFFDFKTNSWTPGPLMNAGRWYPTNTTLANGEVLVVAGTDINQDNNPLPQVFQLNGTYRSLTTAELGMPLYPFMTLAPDGKVFNAGPEQDTRFLNTTGTGAWTPGPRSNFGFRSYGSAALYDIGKLMLVGGGETPPTNTAEIIDLTAANPEWRYTGAMQYARRQHNATVLPDGNVLVTGGTSSPGFNDPSDSVFEAEMWNPVSGQWTTMASHAERRLYHSLAMLLPDGRVLSAGGGLPAAGGTDYDHNNAEIYSPPYLFKGARPSITVAPDEIALGSAFKLKTPEFATISKVSLIRLASVTHSYDMEQRFIPLAFQKGGGSLTVSMPANAAVCPPGYYMLFILNQQGVPSVAKIVRVYAACVTATSPTNQSTAASGGNGNINVVSSNDCGWLATSSVSWVTIVNGSGSGNGMVTYSIAANPAPTTRYAKISIGGSTVFITQDGATANCTTVQAPASGSTSTWYNTPLQAAQTGLFTAEFDVVPKQNAMDGLVALAKGAQSAESGLACIVRFTTSNTIDVRNGGSYQADRKLPYIVGKTYHVRMVVNVPMHTYSVYITPDGENEIRLAASYAFRSEQGGVNNLNHFVITAERTTAAVISELQVCNFSTP